MTYLKGETTWANLLQKIGDLLCGVGADDSAATTVEADRWRRPIPAIPNLLAPPASTDAIVTQEHRAGYWLRVDDCVTVDPTIAKKPLQVMRQKTCWTVWSTSWTGCALFMHAKVTTANTVAGTYSNAVVTFSMVRDDASTTGGVTAQAVTLDAAGNGTLTIGTSVMTFQLTDPSGILAVGACYMRSFTDTYRGGIDFWRGYAKSPTREVTYPVSPPDGGVTGTDWEPTVQRRGTYTVTSVYYNQTPTVANGYSWTYGFGSGMGYKTNIGLTGSRYQVTFAKNEGMVYLHTAGMQVLMYVGGAAVNAGSTASGTTRPVAGYDMGMEGNNHNTTVFLQPFTGTPISTSRVQYWISIKPTHAAIVLNGDSAQSGITSSNCLFKVPPQYTYDTGCWGFYNPITPGNEWFRLGAHSLIERASTAGRDDGGRDWQTGQGRCDFFHQTDNSWFGQHLGFHPMSNSFVLGSCSIYNVGLDTNYYRPIAPISTVYTARNRLAPEWQMTGFYLMDANYGNGGANETAFNAGLWRPRGYLSEGLFHTPRAVDWVSGDEVQDSVSLKKWMLFKQNSAYLQPGGTVLQAVALEQI